MADRGTTPEAPTATQGAAISPARAGLLGRCPQCGRGTMFTGLLTLRQACGHCGFDLRAADPGDGPAVFVVLILGFLAGGLALAVEMSAHPPFWVHLLVLVPVILGGTIALLRLTKGLLVAYQFHHGAHEARLHDDDSH